MTTNIFLVSIVCFALALSLFIGIYALFRSQSSKRNYFLLMQTVIIVYLIGYLLEITSTSAESAFTAVKVLYIGGFFLAPLAFFFVADFCDIKLHPLFVKTPLLVLSSGFILAVWTNDQHRLVYQDYWFDANLSSHLIFIPGLLYFLMRIFLVVCIAIILAVMIYKMKKWKNKYRKRLFVFSFCALIPFLTEAAYFVSIVTGSNPYHINFTPHSVSIMSFFLYAGVVRFNIFEIISTATMSAMEHIKEGFVLLDEENNYLSSNPAAAEVFPEIASIPKGESIHRIANWPEELEDLNSSSFEFSIMNRNLRHYKASISPVYAQNRHLTAKIIIFSDITDNVNLMKKLETAACFDWLTGLYNRKHFTELASASIKRAFRLNQSVYVGMLDIDFFKNVNDTYGHAAGDMILKTTAGIIRRTIRSYDLVGRFGGEEFVFLITDMEPQAVLKMVERLRENTEKNVVVFEDTNIKITCSIGLTKFLEDDTLEGSLKKADAALYFAKNLGRNQVKTCDDLIQSNTAQHFSRL